MIFLPIWFSTLLLKYLTISKASNLCLKNCTQVILVKSSMQSIKYLWPWILYVLVGPQKLVWTNSRGLLAKNSLDLKDDMIFLPFWQGYIWLYGLDMLGKSPTDLFALILTKLSKFMWPNLLCHNQLESSWLIMHEPSLVYDNV